jgi:hypothetical protein
MWLIHNTISHPISGFLFFFGFDKAGSWVHDITLPAGVLDVPQGFIVERVVDLDEADAKELDPPPQIK